MIFLSLPLSVIHKAVKESMEADEKIFAAE